MKIKENKQYNKILIANFIYISGAFLICYILKDIPLFIRYNNYVKIIYLLLIAITLKFIVDVFTYQRLDYIYILFSFFSYLGVLFITLYVRDNTNVNIVEDPRYIKIWIKLIFVNYTVFINLIYNILLFVPLGIFISFINMEYIYKLLIITIFIILNELIQYVYKLGVFDYIDIILNIIGTCIGYILIKIKKGEKYGQRKQKAT